MSAVTKALHDPEMAAIQLLSRLGGRRPSGQLDLQLPEQSPDAVDRMRRAFDEQGSNKASLHSYAGVYAGLLAVLPHQPRILEIGLGTYHLDVPSNMGENGVPGASLRAMREVRPDAEVLGADVDRRILFSEPGISTHWVDQLDPASLSALRATAGGPASCDLVIDDGLHTKRANLNAFRALFPAIRPGGTYVIEDVSESAVPMWRMILHRRRLRYVVLDSGADVESHISAAIVVRADDRTRR